MRACWKPSCAVLATLLAVLGLHAAWGQSPSGTGVAWQAESPDVPRSTVVYPPQSLPLRFSHRLHLAQVGMGCDDCHETARTSRASVDVLVPGEDVCRSCHAIDRSQPEKKVAAGAPPARCIACHPGFRDQAPVARIHIPAPNLKFDHQTHVEAGTTCQQCHGDLAAEGVDLATRAQLPTMQSCLECHNRRADLRACTTCHLAEAGSRMRTSFDVGKLVPSGSLRGDAHDLTFRQDHRNVAQSDERYCESCHRKSFCTDCHDGVVKPMDFHVGDYVVLHAVDARRNQPDCSSCHRLQTFCTGCHARSGVSPDQRISEFPLGAASGSGPRFHPDGWVEVGPGGLIVGSPRASSHAFEAQRNIRACASCHREEFCLDCHSRQQGSMSVNPHPRGWSGSWRCRSLLSHNRRVCTRCHVSAAELRCAPFGAPR